MIVAAIDHPAVAAPRPRLFRGRDIPFWQQRVFEDILFRPIAALDASFDFLLVFDGSRFFWTADAGVGEISDFLKNQDQTRELIFTPPSSPFYAVSRSFFERNRNDFQPGIFPILTIRAAAEEIKIKSPYRIFHPDLEPWRVEEQIVRLQIGRLLADGVTLEDFSHFYLEADIPVGERSVISTGVVIKGGCEIGCDVVLHPHCYIENSRIGDHCVLLPGTIVIDSVVEEDVWLGPYTHLRNGSLVRKGARMGNFVEMKKSVFGAGSKSLHLSYIGDAMVGDNVNIGAGTITCNYDGEKKNPTFIEDNVFIGSGTELVAPVTIGRNSFVAAGSTITQDVPENALAVARQRQSNIENWVLRKRKGKKE